ncbi:MAG TPA: GH116 family glycosyl-hydrolase, partial [Bryobacteraceae bacterium]|nr:GH116 family glycosyl-hydrolase [Bryobacteraceae bacterium]
MKEFSTGRRGFLKTIAGAGVAASIDSPTEVAAAQSTGAVRERIAYPRVFSGRQLKMIAFPLGGVAAGSLALGGRGQLRDWEIFNRPDKGHTPPYAFPSLWVQSQGKKPIARVLESRILPPYEGEDGLGANNVPGLARLAEATFTGEFPLAHIDFHDSQIPVSVSLDAFSPFIPHDGDASGLPVAILRYTIKNTEARPVQASIAFSIENPVDAGHDPSGAANLRAEDSRSNEFRDRNGLQGLIMSNPGIPKDHPMQGTFVLGACGV